MGEKSVWRRGRASDGSCCGGGSGALSYVARPGEPLHGKRPAASQVAMPGHRLSDRLIPPSLSTLHHDKPATGRDRIAAPLPSKRAHGQLARCYHRSSKNTPNPPPLPSPSSRRCDLILALLARRVAGGERDRHAVRLVYVMRCAGERRQKTIFSLPTSTVLDVAIVYQNFRAPSALRPPGGSFGPAKHGSNSRLHRRKKLLTYTHPRRNASREPVVSELLCYGR